VLKFKKNQITKSLLPSVQDWFNSFLLYKAASIWTLDYYKAPLQENDPG